MRGFGHIRQLGHVVTDMNAALEYWTQRLHVGPFFLTPEIKFLDYSYRGTHMPSPTVLIAVTFSAGLQIELIQQLDDTPSAYTEFLSAGRSGLHHYSTWFSQRADYEKARTWALNSKFQLVHESRPEGSSRFAYFETANPAIPLFEPSEALVPEVAEVMRAVELACGEWDGRDPVRPFPARNS